ncbi:MAG: PP2C family protein-serine/threonine phosphatase, partial [Planctomycetota bacterium]
QGKLYSRPCAGGRGGDIHYLSVCNSGLVCQLLLADVVGHGEAVSGVSGEIHSLMRRYLDRLDQRHVLKKLNRRLEKIGFNALTTAAAVNYFPPWRRLSISYAGHPGAWLYRKATRRWTEITCSSQHRHTRRLVNLPLAVDRGTVFTRQTMRVAYGDRLLVLTDGVLEAPNEAGELLGTVRLSELFQETGRLAPGEAVDAIIEALVSRAGETGLSHDDVTLLLVEFVPGPPGSALWHAVKNRLRRRWKAQLGVAGSVDATLGSVTQTEVRWPAMIVDRIGRGCRTGVSRLTCSFLIGAPATLLASLRGCSFLRQPARR